MLTHCNTIIHEMSDLKRDSKLKDCACPLKLAYCFTVYHNREAKDVDFNIYGTSFRSLELSGDKPLHILTIFFLGSINHYPRGNEQRTMTSYVLV